MERKAGSKIRVERKDKMREGGVKMMWQQLEVKAAGLMQCESVGFYFAASGGRL